AGLAVEPVKGSLQNLTAAAPPSSLGGFGSELVLTATRQDDYHGTFQLRPGPPGGAPLQALTLAELRDGQVHITTHLVGRLPGEERLLTVRLRNWQGEGVKLVPGNVSKVSEGKSSGAERMWHVELKPGGASAESRHIDMTLTAALPVERLGGG